MMAKETNNTRLLIGLYYQQLKKRKSNRLVLAFFLLAGFYGLYTGTVNKQHQATTINAFKAQKDSGLARLKKAFSADTLTEQGKAAYQEASDFSNANWVIDIPVYKYPSGTALYHTGQSDVFTPYYSFKAESFIMQLFKQTEIVNPLHSLRGHFDISFWIIFLLPLLAILLGFNALSAENDSGNWKLIFSQGVTARQWLESRFYGIGLILLVLLTIIAIGGTIINYVYFKQLPGSRELLYFTIAVFYLSVWLAILYWINAMGKTTGFNALAGGLTWIGLCVLLPIVVSMAGQMTIPVNSSIISTFSRRPQNPLIEKSDSFSQSLITRYTQQEPQYASPAHIHHPYFRLRTYFAMHNLLHTERWPLVQAYYRAIDRRQQVTAYSTLVNPAGSTDGWMAAIADNDAGAYHQFIRSAAALHQQMKNVLYPSLFLDKPLKKTEYDQLPQFKYTPAPLTTAILLPFLLLAGLALTIRAIANHTLNNMNR